MASAPQFAAVQVHVTVLLPVFIPDDEWIPYAEKLRSEIRGALEALKDDRIDRRGDGEARLQFIDQEEWEVQG